MQISPSIDALKSTEHRTYFLSNRSADLRTLAFDYARTNVCSFGHCILAAFLVRPHVGMCSGTRGRIDGAAEEGV